MFILFYLVNIMDTPPFPFNCHSTIQILCPNNCHSHFPIHLSLPIIVFKVALAVERTGRLRLLALKSGVRRGDGDGSGEEVIRRRRLEIRRQLVSEDDSGLGEDGSGGRSSGSGAGGGVREEEAGAPVVAPCSPTINNSSNTWKRTRRRNWCRAARDRGRSWLVVLCPYRAGGGGSWVAWCCL
jgi:hypothetical protein